MTRFPALFARVSATLRGLCLGSRVLQCGIRTECRCGGGPHGQHHYIGSVAQPLGLRCARDPDGHGFADRRPRAR